MYWRFLFVMVIYIFFSNNSIADAQTRCDSWAKLIHESANFYQVDTQLYRSEQLTTADLALLQQQRIDTIINLRFFNRNKLDVSSTHIDVINKPLLTFSLKPEQIANILWLIENQQNMGKNVLVHCYHGADRTGIVVAMYRIIYQNWTIADAKAEMIQGGFGYHKFWKNIENMLTQQKVAVVRQKLHTIKQLAVS